MLELTTTVVELTGVASPTRMMSSGVLTATLATSILANSKPLAGIGTETEGENSALTTHWASMASGVPITQVVAAAFTVAFGSGVMAVGAQGWFPSFSTVWLCGTDT